MSEKYKNNFEIIIIMIHSLVAIFTQSEKIYQYGLSNLHNISHTPFQVKFTTSTKVS